MSALDVERAAVSGRVMFGGNRSRGDEAAMSNSYFSLFKTVQFHTEYRVNGEHYFFFIQECERGTFYGDYSGLLFFIFGTSLKQPGSSRAAYNLL